MKTSALLMLSALVALGHWLLLGPGPAVLAQITPMAQSIMHSGNAADMANTATAPAILTGERKPNNSTVRILQTRRIESLPLAVTEKIPVKTDPAFKAKNASTSSLGAPPALKPEDAASAAAEPADTAPSTAGNLTSPAPPEPSAGLDAPPLTAMSASAATALAPVQLPKTARLNYDITGQSRGLAYRASGVLDWQQDGKQYEARMVASVFFLGSRTLSSQGEVTADGLAPTRFADKSRSEQAAHFQPDKGKITFSANTPDAPWQRGAQDRLSVFFQLAGMLSGQPDRRVPGTEIPIYTAGARGAITWAFLVDGTENLTLPAGAMFTLKLSRQTRLDYDQSVEIWFAPALSYWPVRIKVTQPNGDFVDQQLASAP